MRRFRFSVSVLLIAVIAITGCTKKPPDPTPPETVLGGSREPGPSWVDNTEFSDSTSAGAVPTRDESGFAMGGDLVKGILPSVHFDYDQALVQAPDREKLKQAAAHLVANPSDNLLVEGHCDWRGTYEFNLALGDRRANGVKDYLVSLGIDPSRIETLSKGDLEALAEGSEEQMANDRRADLIVVR